MHGDTAARHLSGLHRHSSRRRPAPPSATGGTLAPAAHLLSITGKWQRFFFLERKLAKGLFF